MVAMRSLSWLTVLLVVVVVVVVFVQLRDSEKSPGTELKVRVNQDSGVQLLKMKGEGKTCPRSALCGSTNQSVSIHLETMNIEVLKFLFYGLVSSVEFNCSDSKLFGQIGHGVYRVCMQSASIVPQPKDCLVYSFGISYDWSFDEDFSHYGCEVHAFDPSIGKSDHIHPPNISFHNLGLMGFDFTGSNGWKYMKLSSIRKMLGHENRVIDVIKIDAEGAEWSFLRSVVVDDVDELLTVKQLLFEMHTPSGGARTMMSGDFAEVIQYLLELRRLGFLAYANFQNNGCCANFAPLFPRGIPEKCCHETSYVNSRYLGR